VVQLVNLTAHALASPPGRTITVRIESNIIVKGTQLQKSARWSPPIADKMADISWNLYDGEITVLRLG
jgi:hypothetical protein